MLSITNHDFSSIREQWNYLCGQSATRLLFSTPAWAETWWRHFAGDSSLSLISVTLDDRVIGIGPLRVNSNTASFIGSDDVCDFLDFPILPGQEKAFFDALLDHLGKSEVRTLELSPVTPESTVMLYLKDMAQARSFEVTCEKEDVTVFVNLPAGLDQYLASLSGKQRHELLRKERRLNEEGDITFTVIDKPGEQHISAFLRFFRESREDKRAFLSADMEGFFRSVFETCASENMLRLGLLELKSHPVAATLCFDYRDETYLYNSGYDPQYRELSVGVLSKYFHIRDSISKGKKRFDFLKGAEKYKFHLGGREQPVYRCIIKC